MTTEEIKKIFQFYREHCGGFTCTRSDIFCGFHYFEKSKDLVIEYICMVSYWDKKKERFVAQARYTTLTIDDRELQEVVEKMEVYDSRMKELLKEKEESLF